MNNFHGENRENHYFEGWYYKHCGKDGAIAFIPGVNMDARGKKSAFIQVITDTASFNVEYPVSQFACAKNDPAVRVGDSLFSEQGIKININSALLRCEGQLNYGPFSPLCYDIMGPFYFIPILECNHAVISMRHTLSGSMVINGKKYSFDGGTGYIEKDWGSSFPKSYLWVQCNQFGDEPCSVMASIAEIPLFNTAFAGCICAVHYRGREYRLSTYTGARIIRQSSSGFVISQGCIMFCVNVVQSATQKLLAPAAGGMSRTVHESPSCEARFRMFKDNRQLFDLKSGFAGFEYVCPQPVTAGGQ